MKNKPTATKSSSAKSSPKRSSTPSSRGSAETLDVNKNTTASVRQIENGFIVSENGTTGKGRNQQYFNREYFSPTNPVASVKITFGNKK